MKVTVKDCLQLESFRKCIVVAGERSMDNRVKSVYKRIKLNQNGCFIRENTPFHQITSGSFLLSILSLPDYKEPVCQ